MKARYNPLFIKLVFLACIFCNTKVNGNIQVVRGVFDLRESGFEKSKIYSLNGEWEFYWNRLVEPDTFRSKTPPKPDLYGKVPSYWTQYTLNGQVLPPKGYGTYRLVILLPPGVNNKLVIDVPVFDSSFKLFINGEPAGENGMVGISPGSSKAGYKPFLLSMLPKTNSIEIIILASNFQHRRGGFWKEMKIGLADDMIRAHQSFVFTFYLSMGVLMAFSLFFFFFFLFYRKDLLPLFFSIFLAGIFIRLICTGIYPITLLSDISWDWMIRLEYLGTYIAMIAFVWFMHYLYPYKFMKAVNLVNTVILLLFCFFICIAKVNSFTYTILYFQYAIIFYLLFYMVSSFIAIFSKASYNAVYFAGFIILFFALVNDIGLANSKMALTRNYTNHIAVQIFIFMHAIMLIRSWVKAFIEKEKLNREIEYLNVNLEKIITERTAELKETTREISIQSEKIAIQNERLKEEIDFKNRVFSIIAHDLKSPINSLLQFFAIVRGGIDEKVKESALNSIHKLAISANDLIENLLFWGRSQGHQIHVNNQHTDMDRIIRNVIELYKQAASQKSIDLSYDKKENSFAYCDPELVQIVLRNLLSNAIKFTADKGDVDVKLTINPENKSQIEITVSDNGVGIPEEKLKLLSVEQKLESTYGTSREKGTGLGLSICYDLMKLMNGKMDIKSQPGKGTSITILLQTSV